jgi:hypothetical protein
MRRMHGKKFWALADIAPPLAKAPHLFAITPLVGRRSALMEVLKEHGGVACTPYSPQLVDATGGGTPDR